MINRFLDTVWGSAANLLAAPIRRRRWLDLLVLAALVGIVLGLLYAAREWTGAQRPTVQIDLSPFALPKYLFLSLIRAAVAYGISLGFSLSVAYWAAKDPYAEKVLYPILDILQSIPLLSFLPLVVFAMLRLFPHSNIGIELSAVILIVTCQAWNMAFSFYQSLKTLPTEMEDIAAVNGFTWWQRLKWIELPFAAPSLVWNSMVSVANSWFFLMSAEGFKARSQNFQLPGIGSYMNVAAEQNDTRAQIWAVLVMLGIVILLDLLLWKPVVAWSHRFHVDDAVSVERNDNWLLRIFRRSRLLKWIEETRKRLLTRRGPDLAIIRRAKAEIHRPGPWRAWAASGTLVTILVVIALGGLSLLRLLKQVSSDQWLHLFGAGAASLGRVLFSTLLATLWTLPVGLWIGLSPKWSKRLQSVVQVATSFPWSMLFITIILILRKLGVSLSVSCVLLMMVSTQWYLLFNIIAGAQAIPMDLREAMRSFNLSAWRRCKALYFPALFPFLVTGWITATGGAWNASILTEFVTQGSASFQTYGLGAILKQATDEQNMVLLTAATLLMATIVVLFNRFVWMPISRLAETKYALNR
jgi:NitT/TauT family transport system permease protein